MNEGISIMGRLLGFLQGAALVVVIAVGVYILWPLIFQRLPEKLRAKLKKLELQNMPVVNERDEDAGAPRDFEQEMRDRLKSLHLPSVSAGQRILGVPAYSPEQEGVWETDRRVIAAATITAYTIRDPDIVQIFELDGGYMLIVSGTKTIIATKFDLTEFQNEQLQQERKEMVDTYNTPKNDNHMHFEGSDWIIRGAYGQNMHRKTGERACSSIQVVSKLDGEVGSSILPHSIMDGQLHDYYDMRAVNDEGTILFAFHVGEQWFCYMGRVLDSADVAGMKGV